MFFLHDNLNNAGVSQACLCTLNPQALWRTLRNPADSISHVAYRVLGKFGGSNRKMLKESQKLQYVVTEIQGPSITIEFSDCKASIQLPMEKVRA